MMQTGEQNESSRCSLELHLVQQWQNQDPRVSFSPHNAWLALLLADHGARSQLLKLSTGSEIYRSKGCMRVENYLTSLIIQLLHV